MLGALHRESEVPVKKPNPESLFVLISSLIAGVSIPVTFHFLARNHPLVWISILCTTLFGWVIANKFVSDHYDAIEDAKDNQRIKDILAGRHRKQPPTDPNKLLN